MKSMCSVLPGNAGLFDEYRHIDKFYNDDTRCLGAGSDRSRPKSEDGIWNFGRSLRKDPQKTWINFFFYFNLMPRNPIFVE